MSIICKNLEILQGPCRFRIFKKNIHIWKTGFRFPLSQKAKHCWPSSSFWLLQVNFLKLRKKELLPKLNKFNNDNHFYSKRQPRTILSKNSCFENLLSFASSSQQPKTRGRHVEYQSYCASLVLDFVFISHLF